MKTAIISLAALILGNMLGDQATLRDCATKGYTAMLGGGSIVCTIEKEAS